MGKTAKNMNEVDKEEHRITNSMPKPKEPKMNANFNYMYHKTKLVGMTS